MMLSRRQWLTGLGLVLLGRSVLDHGALAAEPLPAPIIRRWPTGNRNLAPIAVHQGQLLGGGDRTLLGIDPQQPKPIWEIEHGIRGGVVFRPRLSGSLLIAAGRDALGAWRIDDGQPLWSYAAHLEIGAPWVGEEMACFGDGHELICLSLLDGQECWRFAATPETKISYAPAATRDRIYVGPGDGRLYALERQSGRLLWRIDRRDLWQYLRQLSVSDGLLIAGAYTERLVALDPAQGEIRWLFNAGNFINSYHIANGLVYFWSPTGWLYALDIDNGQMDWRLQTSNYRNESKNWGSVIAELVSKDGILYVLDLKNHIYLIDALTGHELRHFGLEEPVKPFIAPLAEQSVVCGTQTGEMILLGIPIA